MQYILVRVSAFYLSDVYCHLQEHMHPTYIALECELHAVRNDLVAYPFSRAENGGEISRLFLRCLGDETHFFCPGEPMHLILCMSSESSSAV